MIFPPVRANRKGTLRSPLRYPHRQRQNGSCTRDRRCCPVCRHMTAAWKFSRLYGLSFVPYFGYSWNPCRWGNHNNRNPISLTGLPAFHRSGCRGGQVLPLPEGIRDCRFRSRLLVAAEAISNWSDIPCFFTMSLKMNSAMGERQILPWQTNNILIISFISLHKPSNLDISSFSALFSFLVFYP